jgi:Skp family chaperone for outer membrane proteins
MLTSIILKIKKSRMKKFLLLTVVLGFNALVATAQNGMPPQKNPDKAAQQEKVKALYVAYITNQLQLTPEDAQKFWPVHTQYENEIKGVNKNLPELQKQQAILDIKKKYQTSFTQILGAQRSERFFKIDGEFKHKLLERIRKQNNLPQPKSGA